MSVLAPRSQLERHILEDARWTTDAAWGAPRSGHPEGAVVRHIIQVLLKHRPLVVVETHDDAYRAWRAGQRGDEAKARARAEALIQRLAESRALPLYLAFYQADNEMPGKTAEHRHWFDGLCSSRP